MAAMPALARVCVLLFAISASAVLRLRPLVPSSLPFQPAAFLQGWGVWCLTGVAAFASCCSSAGARHLLQQSGTAHVSQQAQDALV